MRWQSQFADPARAIDAPPVPADAGQACETPVIKGQAGGAQQRMRRQQQQAAAEEEKQEVRQREQQQERRQAAVQQAADEEEEAARHREQKWPQVVRQPQAVAQGPQAVVVQGPFQTDMRGPFAQDTVQGPFAQGPFQQPLAQPPQQAQPPAESPAQGPPQPRHAPAVEQPVQASEGQQGAACAADAAQPASAEGPNPFVNGSLGFMASGPFGDQPADAASLAAPSAGGPGYDEMPPVRVVHHHRTDSLAAVAPDSPREPPFDNPPQFEVHAAPVSWREGGRRPRGRICSEVPSGASLHESTGRVTACLLPCSLLRCRLRRHRHWPRQSCSCWRRLSAELGKTQASASALQLLDGFWRCEGAWGTPP